MIVAAPKNLPSVAVALAGDRDTAFAYVEKAKRSPRGWRSDPAPALPVDGPDPL